MENQVNLVSSIDARFWWIEISGLNVKIKPKVYLHDALFSVRVEYKSVLKIQEALDLQWNSCN